MDQAVQPSFAARGSQRWLQVAVSCAPHLLDAALREAGAIASTATVQWASPLRQAGFVEYRDGAALTALGIGDLPVRPLADFWPPRGPVWDGLGISSDGYKILLEAKAHIAEAASPRSQASPDSLMRIQKALEEARAWYAPNARAVWTESLYQYANRLALHYFLAKVNGIPSRMVFLDFCCDDEMGGPESPQMWKGATEMVHALLGLPKDLRSKGVFHAYVDVGLLKRLAESVCRPSLADRLR